MSNIYLQRYAYSKTYIREPEYGNPDMVIVLPCHNEPDLCASLDAIEACDSPSGQVKIIVVINASATATEEIKQCNEQTLAEAMRWSENRKRKFSYHFILENKLSKKHAGVGLARKIGMDEAVRMFEAQSKDGVILCFDADSTCDANLLVEVEKLFYDHPKAPGCSIHFEHPLEGEMDPKIYEGILNYELHLRYHIDGLKYAGFPYAYQTIGSSMAVRSSAYQKQGGMNRRKAGEDFYFLHKIIPLGNFKELNTTRIIPSPRRSDRVPFGTGRAIGVWLDEDIVECLTYNSQIYKDLKNLFNIVEDLFNSTSIESLWRTLPGSLKTFVSLSEFDSKLVEIKSQSNSLATFQKRFYQWFDGFKVLKFVHFARDEFYPNVPITEAMEWLFNTRNMDASNWSLKQKLVELREIDRSKR